MRRSVALLAVLVLAAGAAVLAVSCRGDDPAPERARKPPRATTTTAPPPRAPLTGLPDPTGLSLGRPALTVKIENSPDARPQTGLEVADVVYEEVVEGGITRFAAVFHSTIPETVGPVRSVRGMDPDIVWPLGGVFAFSGGAPDPVQRIREAPVNAQDETAAGDAMFRDPARAAPHDLYGRTQALVDRGGQPVPPPALFTYREPEAAPVGEQVLQVRLGFSAGYDPTYTFDPWSGTWRRSYGAEGFMTASGQQVGPVNVVVQFTEYPAASEGVTVGEGDVWVFTDGRVVRGRWARPAREAPAAYLDGFGQPLLLTPGSTWVHLLPAGAAVDVVPAPPPPPSTTADDGADRDGKDDKDEEDERARR